MPKSKPAPVPAATRLAAIDVGSNAIRMVVCEVVEGPAFKVVRTLREPVRLGRDVFTQGRICERNMDRAVAAFEKFRQLLDRMAVRQYRAVATSATREAQNRELFLDRVRREAGIELTTIGGEEEARLVHLAVSRRVPMGDGLCLLVDIGGGSVELVLARSGQIVAMESLKMGTVRMLALLQERGGTPGQFMQLAREYVEAPSNWIQQRIGRDTPALFIGTGGNVEALGELARQTFGRDKGDRVSVQELDQLVERMEGLSQLERMQRLALRPDRADVIVPAAIVLQSLMHHLKAEEMLVPGVGLKDGVLEDMFDELFGAREARLHREQVLSATYQVGRKYQFDEKHGRKVAELALQLFDQTASLHQLDGDYRFLLEIGALLHDIGKFVNFSGHHKHSQYLIGSTPIVGLSDRQRAVVAALARYHRKSMPTVAHPFFRDLAPEDRMAVSRLAPLLRIAEALDAEHDSRVDSLQVRLLGKSKLQLELQGQGDLLLEKWSLHSKGAALDKALGVKLVVAG